MIPIRHNEVKISTKATESNFTLTTDGSTENLFLSYSYNRAIREESKKTIITTTRSNLKTSWYMNHDARSHKLVSVSGLSSGKGFGYKTTYPVGHYALRVNIIKPIIATRPNSLIFPDKGVIKVDLHSHKINAIITYIDNKAHIVITKNNIIITNSHFDKQANLIK